MSKVTRDLEMDEDCEVVMITRTPLGHINELDPDKIPAEHVAWYEAELAAYHDAQRFAYGVQDAAAGAYNDRFGSFSGRLAR